MLIAWTTVSERAEAERLARGLIEERLAACVQVEGPVTSYYRWEGQVDTAVEYRLCIKFLAVRRVELEAWLFGRHPYSTPEWVVVDADRVGEKYLSWAWANASSSTL